METLLFFVQVYVLLAAGAYALRKVGGRGRSRNRRVGSRYPAWFWQHVGVRQ